MCITSLLRGKIFTYEKGSTVAYCGKEKKGNHNLLNTYS